MRMAHYVTLQQYPNCLNPLYYPINYSTRVSVKIYHELKHYRLCPHSVDDKCVHVIYYSREITDLDKREKRGQC
jgi:predicted Zn-dependent protease